MNSTPPTNPWWMLPLMFLVVEMVFVIALGMTYLIGDKTLFNVMCTAAITQALGGAGYFFGSSAGSAKKDDALAAVGVGATTTTTTKTTEAEPASPGAPAHPASTATATVTETAKGAVTSAPGAPASHPAP